MHILLILIEISHVICYLNAMDSVLFHFWECKSAYMGIYISIDSANENQSLCEYALSSQQPIGFRSDSGVLLPLSQ